MAPPSDLIASEASPADLPDAVSEQPEGHDFLLGQQARLLESIIYSEVPFRDFFLVSHTDSFFVYRPLYESGGFSDGVKAEIKNWWSLARRPRSSRRALFLHTIEDVQDAVRLLEGQGGTADSIRDRVIRKLMRAEISQEDSWTIWDGGNPKVSMLDTTVLPPGTTPAKALWEALRAAARELLFSKLTTLQLDEIIQYDRADSIKVLVCPDGVIPSSIFDTAFSYLRGAGDIQGSELGDITLIEQALGRSLDTWISEVTGRPLLQAS
jgi:hypothetical protein